MKNKLETTYQFPGNVAPVYANGATGGINVRGEILLKFFTETFIPVEKEVFNFRSAIKASEQTIEEEEAPEEPSTTLETKRIITSEVIMSFDRAEEFHTWLGTQLDNFRKNV